MAGVDVAVVGPSPPVRRTAAGPLNGRREPTLVRAAQRGDEAALEGLFSAHWPSAYRAAVFVVRDPVAAEDIAQEAFLAAVAALDRFDRRRPFGPWLRTIVARRALDALRARTARREVDASAVGESSAAVMTGGMADDLARALHALPDDQRVAVVLRHVLDLSATEIGELLGVPRGTVNSRLRRGLDALEPWAREQR